MQSTSRDPGKAENCILARVLSIGFSARLLCDLHRNVRSALRRCIHHYLLCTDLSHRLNQLGELNHRLSMVKLEVLMRLSLLRYFQQHTIGIWRWGSALRPRCQSQRLQVQFRCRGGSYVSHSSLCLRFIHLSSCRGRWWWWWRFWLVPWHLILDAMIAQLTTNRYLLHGSAHTYTHRSTRTLPSRCKTVFTFNGGCARLSRL